MGTHPIFESDFDCLTESVNRMLRGRAVLLLSGRLSGSQHKWSMLKYRVDIKDFPYHEDQFAIDSDIDFSYLYPKDHPKYRPAGKPVKSEMRLMSKAERKAKYPEFKNWRDSWRHVYADARQGKKEYDQIAMMDFEREEEYYNFKLRTRRTLVKPIEQMNVVHRDLWKHKLHGVTSADETIHHEGGETHNLGTTKESINLLYEEAYRSEEDLNMPMVKRKFHARQFGSKGFTFKADQDGKTNYDWAAIWPSQRSFTDSLVPFDIRQGNRTTAFNLRLRPDKFHNSQLNFSPNLLHLSPPVVKAQCQKLKAFSTKFPVELHTSTKCISAPYQQSSDFSTRWATLFVNAGQLGLDERGIEKLKVFIQGRPEEGKTMRLKSAQTRGHNGKMITYRDWLQQDYRFGDDRFDPMTGMVKLESARCPLKHQNEGYLMYLLETYRNDANKILKIENRGELKNGRFCFEKSRAKKRFNPKGEDNVDVSAYDDMGKAVETMYNKASAKMKTRGHDGFVSHVDLDTPERHCPRQKAYEDYASAMKKLLLSQKQQAA